MHASDLAPVTSDICVSKVLVQGLDISMDTEQGCIHKCNRKTYHLGHRAKHLKPYRVSVLLSYACVESICQLLWQKMQSCYRKTSLHNFNPSPE